MLSTMLMSGCSTYDTVQVKPKKLDSNYSYYLLNPPLYEGDIVQYKLKDGSRNTVTVQKTTPQSLLTSTGQVVPFDDMVSLDKKIYRKENSSSSRRRRWSNGNCHDSCIRSNTRSGLCSDSCRRIKSSGHVTDSNSEHATS